MTEELYFYKLVNGVKTDYTLMDIDKVDIVRSYRTPYFSDVETLKNNGTYTIKIPQTINNKAFFENCHRSDTTSDIPYDYIYADYFYNGLTVFLNAEVKVLDTVLFYEVQCVYGVNRLKYLPLFENKLNEIPINETTITSDDWVVDWRKGNGVNTGMYLPNKKYKYIDYISGQRTTDQETIGGVIQPLLAIPSPFNGHEKQMTMHPFIEYGNIIDLITTYCSIGDFDTTDLKSRIENKGLLLNERQQEIKEYIRTITVADASYTNKQTFDLSDFTDELNLLTLDNAEEGEHSFGIVNMSTTNEIIVTFVIDFYSNRDGFKLIYNLDTIIVANTFDDGQYHYQDTFEIKISSTNFNFRLTFSDYGDFTTDAGQILIKYKVEKDFYSLSTKNGKYFCIDNMPKINLAEAIQQALIHTCGFLGYTSSGELKTYFFDEFVDNLHNGAVYDWSTRYSGLRKSTFQFNGNAQKNYLKFANDKDLKNRNEYVTVNDRTIESEKDLYVLKFDSPLGAENEKSDYILYEQTVKRSGETGISFENKYVGDKWQHAFVIDDNGTAKNINIIGTNYATYQKLIERPIVYECDINLSVYESANIDFAKPIYIDVLGKYCLLLELQAPNNELCAAKLLLINQIL